MLPRHYLEQGVSKSALAHQLGIGWDTIHRWIRAGDLDRDLDAGPVQYGPRPPVATKLDAFKAILRARLDAYPELSAVRLLEEIRAAGYTGGYTQLKEYVRRMRPLPEPEPVVRFETPAGRQAQVDFARFRFHWGVRYALLVVLGYSRVLWLRFYRRQDMRTLLGGLEEAFAFFGGVAQELLFDQMKSVITKDLRLLGGDLVRNAEFLRLADHFCEPLHGSVYDPCYAECAGQHCAAMAHETSPRLVTSDVTRAVACREESYTDPATWNWADLRE